MVCLLVCLALVIVAIIKFLTDFSFFENNMQENLSTWKGYILNSAISSYNKFCLPKSKFYDCSKTIEEQ